MDFSFCEWDAPFLLVFSDNVFAQLVYYSHFVPLILSLLVGIFVLIQKPKGLLNRLLFIITILFGTWIFFDLILWATNNPLQTMFFWPIINLIEPVIYITSIYFLYVFINNKDISFNKKVIFLLLLLPTVILTPTRLALQGFDFTNCDREAIEGIMVYYNYLVEVISGLWIFIYGFSAYRKRELKSERKQIFLVTIGLFLFLFSFAFGNIVGSLNIDWTLGQYGLFGLPIFVGFLAYLVSKYNTFNTKTFTAQITSTLTIILVFALLFVRTIQTVRIIVIPTLVVLVILSIVLIRGVQKEIQQRKRIEALAKELEKANLSLADANNKLKSLDKLKTEFLSLASHQLRSPLTAIKGYASMLSEGDFGVLDEKQSGATKRIYASAQGLVNLVEDLLNVSKIEQGGMKYEFMPTDLSKTVNELAGEMKIPAENKKLELRVSVPSHDRFMAIADPTKIRQVFLNMVDNSIKYTPSGFIEIALSRDEKHNIIFSVKDSGVGVTKETKEKLFQKFSRGGEGSKINTGGSGLGLYLAQEIAKAHKGEIKVESDGINKGATFSVVLPAVESQKNGSYLTT